MRASWHAIHRDLVRSTQTLRFQRRFERLRGLSPELQAFADPAALLDRLHAPGREPELRNDLLRALLAGRSAEDDAADVLLLLALWPGLDAVRGRLHRSFVSRSDELAAEITARAAEVLLRVDLGRVTWVAATVIRNVERDIRRAVRRDRDRARRSEPLDEGLTISGGDPVESALFARQLTELAERDADLLLRVAIHGESQADAARRLRVTPAAARKRYQRALKRVRQAMSEAA